MKNDAPDVLGMPNETFSVLEGFGFAGQILWRARQREQMGIPEPSIDDLIKRLRAIENGEVDATIQAELQHSH